MFQNLDMFKTAMSMARHAGLKQALTSQNVANSDTPGYRAMSVKSFADMFSDSATDFSLRSTRSSHLEPFSSMETISAATRSRGEPNGNNVVLETEILNSVDAKRQHDRALAVYRASLGMLRSTLSKQ
jgi:flagellar basal-body rod protein FlgB